MGKMRSHPEIEHVADLLSNWPESLEWEGDNFRYGYHMGKLATLAWVLGQPAADRIIAGDYTFADWRSEVEALGHDPVESLQRRASATIGEEDLR